MLGITITIKAPLSIKSPSKKLGGGGGGGKNPKKKNKSKLCLTYAVISQLPCLYPVMQTQLQTQIFAAYFLVLFYKR